MNMIPEQTILTIKNYVEKRYPPGSFVKCVLANDLKGAFGSADIYNRAAMFEIVKFLYNEIPQNAWGSYEAIDEWLKGEKSC